MNKNLTDLNVIIDRSGSMSSMEGEANTSLSQFIKEQKEIEGECHLNFVEFDNYPNTVYSGNLNYFDGYRLEPRGATALLDTIGKTITETGNRLAAIPEKNRPGLVIMMILTDGHENCSKEFRMAQIKEMIEHQQTKYNWQFVFLGAGLDVAKQGQDLAMASAFSFNSYSGATKGASANVSRMRGASRNGQNIQNFYTQEELKNMGAK